VKHARRVACDILNVDRFTEDNPLDIPNYGGTGVTHPSMLYFPEGVDGYKYWMVYTPYPPASEEEPCIARSNNGVDFVDTGISNPVVTKTEDWEDVIHDPNWIKDGKKWHMFYGALDNTCPVVPWITRKVTNSWKMLKKCMYYLYYGAIGKIHSSWKHHIAYVESTNGKTWIDKQKVLDHNTIVNNCKINNEYIDRGGLSPASIKVGNAFYVFFAGQKDGSPRTWGIYYASGSSPTNLSIGNNGNPILKKTSNSYDDPFFQHLDVFFWNGDYWLIYQCSTTDDPNHGQFALAKFENFPNILNKCIENPIMSYDDEDAEDWEKRACYKPGPIVVCNKLLLYYSAYTRAPETGLNHRIGHARILFTWERGI